MPALSIYDPPQCCATGVCGPDLDPALVQFASDLRALVADGVAVERFNLAQQPEAFLAAPVVRHAVEVGGTAVLPLVLADDVVVAQGRYPSRDELTRFAGLAPADDDAPTFDLILLAGGDACAPGGDCC